MPPLTQCILEGKEQPKTVLIHDDLEESGKGLLNSFIYNLCTKVDQVHLILTSGCIHKRLRCFPDSIQQKIIVHDGTSDPLAWRDQGSDRTLNLDASITEYVANIIGSIRGTDTVGLVFDNISSLIFLKGIATVCQMIHALSHLSHGSTVISQIVALVHEDLHDPGALALLDYSSACILRVAPPKHQDFHITCQTLQKRTSGKVVKSNDHILFGKGWSLVSCEEVLSIQKSQAGAGLDSIDPTANLTFNLSLTEKEKADKDNVVLPYTKPSTKVLTEKGDGGGGGKIFYQPDDADDFDEEDPDDDLDI